MEFQFCEYSFGSILHFETFSIDKILLLEVLTELIDKLISGEATELCKQGFPQCKQFSIER